LAGSARWVCCSEGSASALPRVGQRTDGHRFLAHDELQRSLRGPSE